MIYFFDNSGFCVAQKSQVSFSEEEKKRWQKDFLFSQMVLTETAFDFQKIYFDGTIKLMPERPNENFTFDIKNKIWVDLRTDFEVLKKIRSEREYELQKTDWTQLLDAPNETRLKFKEYRQALRDITKQKDPRNVVWPTPPA